jgi:chromosome segregation ATPase
VQSYDRVSDLDDTLHVTSANLRSSTLKISELEIERSQHLDALNTGLLVERGTITTELTRLMERVTEETAQRGLAESAKQEIEKDLDDLSANLFNQANTMVAEARYARAMSERKAEEAQRALKGAEEAISIMQMQMQNLSTDNEAIEQELVAARQRMEKGKWIADDHSPSLELFPKLSTAHLPYQEFLLFNSHLRSIRTRNDPPPLLSNFVHLAFITRLQIEDS